MTVLSSGFTVIVLESETHLKGSGIALPVVSHQGSIRKRANNNTAVIIEIILFSHSSQNNKSLSHDTKNIII